MNVWAKCVPAGKPLTIDCKTHIFRWQATSAQALVAARQEIANESQRCFARARSVYSSQSKTTSGVRAHNQCDAFCWGLCVLYCRPPSTSAQILTFKLNALGCRTTFVWHCSRPQASEEGTVQLWNNLNTTSRRDEQRELERGHTVICNLLNRVRRCSGPANTRLPRTATAARGSSNSTMSIIYVLRPASFALYIHGTAARHAAADTHTHLARQRRTVRQLNTSPARVV